MPQFQDNAGRTWTVELNVDAIKRVRSLLGLDLLGEAPALGAWPIRTTAPPIPPARDYVPEHLREKRVFTSVLTVPYDVTN